MTQESATHLVNTSSTLQTALNGWLMYLEDQGKSPHTLKAFGADIRLLDSFLPDGLPVGSVTTAQLNDFLEWLQDGRGVPCSPKTLARRITSIKAFFRWLQGGGVILVDPSEKVVQKSVISPLPTVLDPQEVEMALEAADGFRQGDSPDHRHYTLLLLLLNTGIKKNETLNLNPRTSIARPPTGRSSSSATRARHTATRNGKSRSPVNGLTLTNATRLKTTPAKKSFPGRPGASNTCSKTSAMPPI